MQDNDPKQRKNEVLVGAACWTLAFIGFGAAVFCLLAIMSNQGTDAALFAIASAIGLGLLLNALTRT